MATPLLKKHGVEYYNPALRDQHPADCASSDDVTEWRREIEQCRILLFVITNDTRSLTSMILAAHYVGMGKNVVLSIEQLDGDSCVVADETVSWILKENIPLSSNLLMWVG